MTERLKELIESEKYTEARLLANEMLRKGEESEAFWILNAFLYRIEGRTAEEYASISQGLQKNPANYELYYMLGNFYRESNTNQAWLCYEQAAYYCDNAEDSALIEESLKELHASGTCSVHPVSIVILSYNTADILKECIQSIRDYNPESAYELVVVDNASTDGAADWLREQSDIKVRCNTENQGYARGCNQGMKLASPENDILLLNNDTIVPKNTLFWLRMGLYERATVGAVGPLTNYAGNEQMLAKKLETPEEYLKFAEKICVPMMDCCEHKLWLAGFALMIKRSALDDVGMLDTRYEYGNYEDTDYGMKLGAGGYELLLCHNSFIYHYGSLNTAKDSGEYTHGRMQDSQKFVDKWGFNVTYYSRARTDLIRRICSPTKTALRVLEVGCGCGATLARIKYIYPSAQCFGVELMQNIAGFGKYMGNILVGDIETTDLPYEKNSFDYAIFGDVLEHLRDPKRVICRMRDYLKPDGKILASIPNIMNISVIVSLLKGNFTYRDEGLLDRTHIHFFTAKEMGRMFQRCGYEIRWLDAVCIRDESMTENDEALIEAIYRLPGIEPQTEFEAYQYLVEAGLKEDV